MYKLHYFFIAVRKTQFIRRLLKWKQLLFNPVPKKVVYIYSTLNSTIESMLEDGLIHKTVKQLGVSAITITHDISSINNLASRVILLDSNKIVWSGKPNSMKTSKNNIVKQFLINK